MALNRVSLAMGCFSAGFLTLLTACSGGPEQVSGYRNRTGGSRLNIVQGRDAEGFLLKHTVGISWSDAPDRQRPYCTGTLISAQPPLVLTAAHCAQGEVGRQPSRPGIPNYVYFTDGVLRKVVRAVPRSDWYFSYADIAVLEFEGPVPEGYEPAEILESEDILAADVEANRESIGNASGDPSENHSGDPTGNSGAYLNHGLSSKEFLIAGWGRTTTMGGSPDRLQAASVRLWKFWRSGFGLGLLAFESRDGQGACYGDSGGPAFYEINGKWLLVGVTHGSNSAFLRNLPLGLQGNCDVGKSLYTSAARFKGWILSEFPNAQLAGGAGAAEVWTGTAKAQSFLEACQLGEKLEYAQWKSVLDVILRTGTPDCQAADEQAKALGISAALGAEVLPLPPIE